MRWACALYMVVHAGIMLGSMTVAWLPQSLQHGFVVACIASCVYNGAGA